MKINENSSGRKKFLNQKIDLYYFQYFVSSKIILETKNFFLAEKIYLGSIFFHN